MKFTQALWDQDRAQLIFKTDLIAPVTGQPYRLAMTGVGNIDEARRIFLEMEVFGELEIEQSRYGLLKSIGPLGGSSTPSADRLRARWEKREPQDDTWERPYTRHYGDLDPADSFEPGD